MKNKDFVQNQKIKVIFDHQIWALQSYGGVSKYFSELIGKLGRIPSLELDLFMGFHKSNYSPNLPKKNSTNFGKTYLFNTSSSIGQRLNSSLFYIKHFGLTNQKKVAKKPMVYHPTYFNHLLPFKGIPRIITVYDMIPELFAWNSNTINEKKRAILEADAIIAISKNTKNDILRFFDICEEKIHVIYISGSFDEIPLSQVPILPNELKLHRYILYTGKRGGYKNFLSLLNAYGSSKEINQQFFLVCVGGEEFSKKEKEIAHKWGITKNLFHYIPSDRFLVSLYRNASVFVYPSLYEGFGIPPLDAISQGCPVVASCTSSIPEVLGEAALYFDPRSEKELQKALITLLFDNSLIEELHRKGIARSKCFSWQKCADKTTVVYSSFF